MPSSSLKTESDDRLGGLSSVLFPPDTPVDDLPVSGYRPYDQASEWRPRQAAVLLPFVRSPEPELVLTVRSDAVATHAGQVALPGGGHEGSEAFPVQTALRETFEETGIDAGSVEVVGLMQRFDTISNYRIVPVVGVIDQRPVFKACPREVRTIFTVPLERVFNPASYCQHEVRREGQTFEVWSMRTDCWPIWGATAAILAHLAQLVSGRTPA